MNIKLNNYTMLTGNEIKKMIDEGKISIQPFDIKNLGSNSYDVTIGNELLIYPKPLWACIPFVKKFWYLDCKKKPKTKSITIPENGYVLRPGKFYLGSTVERTESDYFIPEINGKSSLGRLSLAIHITAGFGDLGFKGQWTLEMTVIQPLKIYPGQKIGQIQFDVPVGQCQGLLYHEKNNPKYSDQIGVRESEMYQNFL